MDTSGVRIRVFLRRMLSIFLGPYRRDHINAHTHSNTNNTENVIDTILVAFIYIILFKKNYKIIYKFNTNTILYAHDNDF